MTLFLLPFQKLKYIKYKYQIMANQLERHKFSIFIFDKCYKLIHYYTKQFDT